MILKEFEEDGELILVTEHMIVSEGALVAVTLYEEKSQNLRVSGSG
jgi:hypothetical protein